MDKIIIDSYFDYLALIWILMFFIWIILSLLHRGDLDIIGYFKVLLIMTIIVFVAVTGAYFMDNIILIS